MQAETAFTRTTILKNIEIQIDNNKLISDDIISINFKQNFDEFGITGSIKIKDSFDINNNKLTILNGDNKVIVSLTDFMGNKSKRTFRIINTVINPSQERFKLYEFTLIDEITFILSNAYISKSFNSTSVQALTEYLTHLGIDDLIAADNLVLDIKDTAIKQTFVVPQNISVLEFFTEFLSYENIRFYQDRAGLHIEEINLQTLIPGKKKDGTTIQYSNNSNNQEYLYKIHDFQEHKNSTNVTNFQEPVTRTFRYSSDKQIQDNTKNLIDETKLLKLNTINVDGLQLTTGEKYNSQIITGTKNQQYNLFNTYMKNNQIHIVVPGELKNSNIGGIADLNMKGSILTADTIKKGDIMTSGKYFIGAVSDVIIGDKLIHRMSMYRLDAKEPR